MRIAIFGAGAIGGFLAVKLIRAGVDVVVIARGPHLDAIRRHGITLIENGVRTTVTARCLLPEDAPGGLDYIFATLKAHSVTAAADKIASLVSPETAIVMATNGIPYWYFYGLDSKWRDRTIESVDPGGVIARAISPAHIIGCVVYPAVEVVEPGVILHLSGNRFSIGEPDGSKSERVKRLSAQMIAAGLKAPIRSQLRDELWIKLWGNLALNPLSVLTGSTLDRLAGEPDLREVSRAMMREAQAVAEALGVKFAVTLEQRLDGARDVGAHKTSMLQDLERGRPLETEALLGAVVELGALTGIAMPMCAAILALVRERARRAIGNRLTIRGD